MVVTRSAAFSPDTVSADVTRRPAADVAPVQGTLGDVSASRASMPDAPLLMPTAASRGSAAPDGFSTPAPDGSSAPGVFAAPCGSSAPGWSAAPGGFAASGGSAAPGVSAAPGGSAAAGAAAFDAASAPVVMSTDQLLLLINRLSRGDTVSTTTHTYSGNFAKCTARFDGDKSSNVQAFIDAVLTYKDCVGVNDDIALRGLPMLLTGLAATWWQGVKDSTPTWQDAMEALKQTFGPRLPPHKIYRLIFEREQRADESTDLFVCHLRALFSQLPSFTLSETVQLDMCYGLLHRRIREKVPRTSFNDFSDLLTQTRRAEDILDESGRARTSTESKPAVTTYSTVAKPSSPATSSSSSNKFRSYCNYCRQYGHAKDDCLRLANRLKKNSKEGGSEMRATTPTVTCFGCGAPGVIRSNCPTCSNKKNAPTNNNVNSFQSISASGDNIDSRVRPVLNININGAVGKVLVDTGAKHSVGSVSLRAHLVQTGHSFENIFAEFKYADGRVVAQSVEVANVKITVRNVNINVDFVMLPNATESLLGMNFIEDAGMVLDFKRNVWFMECDKTPQPIEFESRQLRVLSCSSVGLREDEGTYLNADDRRKLDHLLNEYDDLFRPGGGPTDYAIHRIDTGDAAPIACPPYRVTPAKKEIIKKEIEKMLEEDIIEEAESEWAAPVVLVPKKNGETRFCVDYRKLNSVTRADKYPLPVIDELLLNTKPGCVMSSIDLKSGYWQVLVAPEDRHKTTFTSPFGNFSFKRLPFGLKNAPATFQRLIDRMRSGLKDVCILAYLDDLFVISPHLEQHLKDLQLVFERLRLFNLTANRTKCVFVRERLTYLGHVVSSSGIEADPSKVEAVMNMKPPTNLKELRTFLQTCAWFRKFIPQFSDVARCLTDLTKKDRRWSWGEKEQESFERLKSLLADSPILRQPDFDKPFVLRTDASAYALGAVLMQGEGPKDEQPIEYASRLLTSAERNYHTTEKEALAVVWALEKFRGYVEGAQVRVATDHQPLKWLLTLKTPSGRLARWAMKIQAYNLEIGYTPGKANVVADTLSRPVAGMTTEEPNLNPCGLCPVVIDLPQRRPEDIRQAQLNDPDLNKIIQDFENDKDPAVAVRWTDRGYYLIQGVLFRCHPDWDSEEPQLVVPESMRDELMKELHDAPTAGHLGVERTLKKIRERYYFPNMRAYVMKYLKTCDLCQKYKASNLKPAGLLQTPVPRQRFEVLAMDLFGPLPEGSKGEKWILLVEDTASRWTEVFALGDATAESCAKTLIEEVFLRYGLPRRVISDNGTQFVSAVMQKAMLVLGIQQSLIPVYHPEANPAERKNRELKQLLSILVGAEHCQWPTVLPMVRFALNSAHNQGTGHSAAYLTFAREMRSPISVQTDIRAIVAEQNYVPQITPYLKEFARVLVDVKERVEIQQEIRKDQGDLRRREAPPYKNGDLVLVETHMASNASKGFTGKFAPKREGPYRVSKAIGPTSFLIIDKTGRIKGKYHTSALTPYLGEMNVVQHPRRRGRPTKPQTRRSCGLEGEVVAHRSSDANTPAPTLPTSMRERRARRPPRRLLE